MKDICSSAIARFQSIGEVVVNDKTVYATYISAVYHDFLRTEDEAIAATSAPEYGAKFNNTWLQGTYIHFLPGELFMVKGQRCVYLSKDRSRCVDAIADISFVEWAFMPAKD